MHKAGIAVVTSKTDDFDLHVGDTLISGDGLCDEGVVKQIVEEGPARVQELIRLGLEFTRIDEGSYTPWERREDTRNGAYCTSPI